MGLGTIFVLYVSFMLIYSDQADVIEERVEATVLAKLMEKAGLLPMSLTARKINERLECVTKIIPIPYTAYVHRVFMYMLEVKIKGVLFRSGPYTTVERKIQEGKEKQRRPISESSYLILTKEFAQKDFVKAIF
ncbi:epidermal growth factor receptor isoform X2 [Vespula maculifrons]|uniref:Epidermal growth factor receptor isoform X2 n=1 Tax=Vespula maculifrons TaxID=7453 RepID=A0ABD2AXC7_VESMC